MKQSLSKYKNFPLVVSDSFALLGFAEIDKNDDMGLL